MSNNITRSTAKQYTLDASFNEVLYKAGFEIGGRKFDLYFDLSGVNVEDLVSAAIAQAKRNFYNNHRILGDTSDVKRGKVLDGFEQAGKHVHRFSEGGTLQVDPVTEAFNRLRALPPGDVRKNGAQGIALAYGVEVPADLLS